MLSKFGRLLFIILSVIVVIAIILGAFSVYLVRKSFPRTSGEVELSGLEFPVNIYRDSFGIPQIYAQTVHDLFFAQGYVHAQDRFWQMDFWRHIGSGRLSEMFGESQLETDVFLRTLGWEKIAQQELESLSPEDAAPLQAYADGVNAYLADHTGAALSLEYTILKLNNSSYSPEPWNPVNTLTWAKVMAWDLGSSRMYSEAMHAILMKTLTPEQLDDLFPPYPTDHPVVVTSTSASIANSEGTAQAESLMTLTQLSPAFRSILDEMSLMEAVIGPTGSGIGSNNWVIAGTRTSTGKPFLANDMHLSEMMPSIWYENGLHCTTIGTFCPFNVTGYSFPGVPGVVVGHNDRVAWGFTNVGPDVLDLYIERINPENPNQYEVNGQWVEMELVQETIEVAGGDPVELTVRHTRHGPVIWDDAESQQTEKEAWGIDLPENFAISMRWTALERVNIVKAILGYNSAQNWEEFRQAAVYFSVPSQNTVFADVDGNIAYQTPGNIPIRKPGHTGTYPVPGWTDDYEWQGYIPFEELPTTFNPPEGYIASANNAVVGPKYPYSITTEWDYGYRAERIVEMIESAPGPIDPAYIQTIHGDNYNASAEFMLPLLMMLDLPDAHLVEVRDVLAGWDYQNHMDSAASAVYNTFWRAVLARTFRDELPEDYWPDGDSAWFEIVRQLVQSPDSEWWDDQNTPKIERMNDTLALAFSDGVAELEGLLGTNASRWTWGDLHTVVFHNQSLGTSGITPIEAIFNRGPYRTSGGSSIVNATSSNFAESDPVKAYQVSWLPSERMIVDLSNLSASVSLNTTGQSGHAFHPNYDDQIDLWRTIQYHPMLWEDTQVQEATEEHLVLMP